VKGRWNGAVLKIGMAHSSDGKEWIPIEGANFEPISNDSDQELSFILPNDYYRIEYWLENED
jgi:hypothetical protein